ncbi:MAG: bifunctional phosphopantothenoylcysteine decarboxylase/phosphopantothenate--cysteine ligase CoaBC [Actinomycetota bacterium]
MEPTGVAGKRIVLGVCGGIAAYKVVELGRRLTKAGADVQVVMTLAATEFVGPLTFSVLTGHPVLSDLFAQPVPGEVVHTTLARSADLVVVAPATATMLARYTHGLADDILSALLLATTAPVIMAPAMHTEMWENPATVANVATLRRRGVVLVGPDNGALAGPDVGPGRLAEVPAILAAIEQVLRQRSDFAGRRVVVSAGGTQEPLDPVRYLGNRSSGRMGYELAAEAVRRGAQLTLVTAPTSLAPPLGADVLPVRTAAQLMAAMRSAATGADVVIMAAAVADWRPVAPAGGKLKKAEGPPSFELEATEDVLAFLGRAEEEGGGRHNGQVVVGFAAETEDPEAGARAKLASKGLDLVVGNLVGAPGVVEDSGFEAETNRAVLVDRLGRVDRLPLMSKRDLAGVILDAVRERFLEA